MTHDIAPASARKPSDVLEAAADLIEPEGAWTQGAMARGKSGRYVDERGRHAICFCAVGAIKRTGSPPAYNRVRRYLMALLGTRVTVWNDRPGRTQAEVVAALRKAAALARSEGQ